MNGRPALVACDLDGTLLDDSGVVAPGVVEAIGELHAAGVLVVICTGRTVAATRAAAARLGLCSGPAISYHGAVVVDLADGRWLQRLELPRAAVGPVVRALHGAGATFTAYVDDERWVQGGPPRAGGAGAASAAPAETRVHADLAAALEGRPVTRIVVEAGAASGPGAGAGSWPSAGARDSPADLLAGLASRLADVAVSPAPGGRFEVHHAGADKRTALAALCGRLEVPASAVVACGDGAVDAGMIGWAGLGVAVAEGHGAAADVAGRVVARGDLATLLTGLARLPRIDGGGASG